MCPWEAPREATPTSPYDITRQEEFNPLRAVLSGGRWAGGIGSRVRSGLETLGVRGPARLHIPPSPKIAQRGVRPSGRPRRSDWVRDESGLPSGRATSRPGTEPSIERATVRCLPRGPGAVQAPRRPSFSGAVAACGGSGGGGPARLATFPFPGSMAGQGRNGQTGVMGGVVGEGPFTAGFGLAGWTGTWPGVGGARGVFERNRGCRGGLLVSLAPHKKRGRPDGRPRSLCLWLLAYHLQASCLFGGRLLFRGRPIVSTSAACHGQSQEQDGGGLTQFD